MKKIITKPKKISLVDRLAGSLNHLVVSKSKLKVSTEQAIKIARDIAAKEIAHE